MSEQVEPRPWHCPNCGGHGTMPDAVVSYGQGGAVLVKPASPCWLCGGKGLVLIQPLPDDYQGRARRTIGE